MTPKNQAARGENRCGGFNNKCGGFSNRCGGFSNRCGGFAGASASKNSTATAAQRAWQAARVVLA